MTVSEFQRAWRGHPLNERQAYQTHFNDLCELVGHPKPGPTTAPDFLFEKAVTRFGGGKGFADVWKRDFFGIEYKGPHANLQAAARQLLLYRKDLENPPLLVVCDTDLIRISTDFSRTENVEHDVRLEDLSDPDSLRLLEWMFWDPDKLRPTRSPDEVTQAVAARIGDIAGSMRDRGVPADQAAHFLMKVIFSLFAEDVGLLPRRLFTELIEATRDEPPAFTDSIRQLFAAMASGGRFFFKPIEWFNGGLFDDELVLDLTRPELRILAEVAKDDWANLEPAVFGTLFERCLDPAKRGQLGAHYTSRADIERIIEPVLMAPLRREWLTVRETCDAKAAEAEAAGPQARVNRRKEIESAIAGFMERLAQIQVLDPACGSGNFLYVALGALKDLELEVLEATAQWGVQAPFPAVDPGQLHGLELDPYAAELAQVTCWIGYLQWNHKRKFQGSDRPLLRKLDNIRRMDALVGINERGELVAPVWPEADVIVGNPPFLGGKKLRTELGDAYIEQVFKVYDGRVPREADLCCYWFERAREQISGGRAKRAGLLATNSIRQGAQMRPVLQKLKETGDIFMAWSDEPWILDGAAVRIALLGFDDGSETERRLDGEVVESINPDLTSGLDLSTAQRLKENQGIAFMGDTKGGAFDIPGDLARKMLAAKNPSGRDNADVVVPWYNGLDIMRRPRDMWIIDFGCDLPEAVAAQYEEPFTYVRENVYPVRRTNRRKSYAEKWWIHVEPRPAMRRGIDGLGAYLVTATVGRHRVFARIAPPVLPDHQLICMASDDWSVFGELSSRPHMAWAIHQASSLGVGNDPRYTPTTCFETFPFPRPTDAQREAIAEAARGVEAYRQGALAADGKLTMTAIYNGLAAGKRPDLELRHKALDAAVLTAYGWDDLIAGLPAYGEDAPDWTGELLRRLLELNLARAAEEAGGD